MSPPPGQGGPQTPHTHTREWSLVFRQVEDFVEIAFLGTVKATRVFILVEACGRAGDVAPRGGRLQLPRAHVSPSATPAGGGGQDAHAPRPAPPRGNCRGTAGTDAQMRGADLQAPAGGRSTPQEPCFLLGRDAPQPRAQPLPPPSSVCTPTGHGRAGSPAHAVQTPGRQVFGTEAIPRTSEIGTGQGQAPESDIKRSNSHNTATHSIRSPQRRGFHADTVPCRALTAGQKGDNRHTRDQEKKWVHVM